MLVGFILNLVFNLTLRYLYGRENQKRDAALAGKTEEEIEGLKEESRKQGFENITDKQNVSHEWPLRTKRADCYDRCSLDMYCERIQQGVRLTALNRWY